MLASVFGVAYDYVSFEESFSVAVLMCDDDSRRTAATAQQQAYKSTPQKKSIYDGASPHAAPN